MKFKIVIMTAILSAGLFSAGCSKIMDQRPYKDSSQVKNLVFITEMEAEDRFTEIKGNAKIYKVLPGCKGKDFLGNVRLDQGRTSAAIPVNQLMLVRFEIIRHNLKTKRTTISEETLIKLSPGERAAVQYYYKDNKYRYRIKVKKINGKEENYFAIPWSGCKKML